MVRHRLDPVLGEVLIARYRPSQVCRSCKSYKPASAFGLSRILKRDYECRRCHAIRCGRERLLKVRGRR